MRFFGSVASYFMHFLRSFVLYLTVVIGGITLFLIVTPLFGYLSYSDRPGSGWFGAFPALGWHAFWANTWHMLDYGLAFAWFFAFPATLCAAVIVLFDRVCRLRVVTRIVGGTLAGLVAGYWMLIILVGTLPLAQRCRSLRHSNSAVAKSTETTRHPCWAAAADWMPRPQPRSSRRRPGG